MLWWTCSTLLLFTTFPRIAPDQHLPRQRTMSTMPHLYTHVHRLSETVNRVSVGLDVAHTQSRHLDEHTEKCVRDIKRAKEDCEWDSVAVYTHEKYSCTTTWIIWRLTFWMVPLRLRIIISTLCATSCVCFWRSNSTAGSMGGISAGLRVNPRLR